MEWRDLPPLARKAYEEAQRARMRVAPVAALVGVALALSAVQRDGKAVAKEREEARARYAGILTR